MSLAQALRGSRPLLGLLGIASTLFGTVLLEVAQAAPIYSSQVRSVEAIAVLPSGDTHDFAAAPDLGDFAAGVSAAGGGYSASASQTSMLDSTSISVAGGAGLGLPFYGFDGYGIFAASSFQTTFELTEIHDYSLSGEFFFMWDHGGALDSLAFFGLALEGPGGIVFDHSVNPSTKDGLELPFDESGYLTAGMYVLTVFYQDHFPSSNVGDIGGGGGGSFSVDLALSTPIPEPNAALLFLVGLPIIGMSVRRRMN